MCTQVGVGYRASVAGQKLTLNLGYSHPIQMEVPKGLEVKVCVFRALCSLTSLGLLVTLHPCRGGLFSLSAAGSAGLDRLTCPGRPATAKRLLSCRMCI